VVTATCLGIRRIATGLGAHAAGPSAGFGAHSDCNRARVRAKSEMATLKLVEGALVLEENDLAIGLRPRLQSRAEEIYGRVARENPLHVNASLSMSTPDDEPGAADGRKYGVSVRLCEKHAAFIGLFEVANGVVIAIGASETRADTGKEENREHRSKHFIHRRSPVTSQGVLNEAVSAAIRSANCPIKSLQACATADGSPELMGLRSKAALRFASGECPDGTIVQLTRIEA